jgi:hypothetical protein
MIVVRAMAAMTGVRLGFGRNAAETEPFPIGRITGYRLKWLRQALGGWPPNRKLAVNGRVDGTPAVNFVGKCLCGHENLLHLDSPRSE